MAWLSTKPRASKITALKVVGGILAVFGLVVLVLHLLNPALGKTVLMGAGILLMLIVFFLVKPPGNEATGMINDLRNRDQAEKQGRLPAAELARDLGIEEGIPLAHRRGQQSAFHPATGRHGAGPTGSGKGLHLSESYLRWPGAAVVIDPKGEQYARMSGHRAQFGRLRAAGDTIDLARYYDLTDADDVTELHLHANPFLDGDHSIFMKKPRALGHRPAPGGTTGIGVRRAQRGRPLRATRRTRHDRLASSSVLNGATIAAAMDAALCKAPGHTHQPHVRLWQARGHGRANERS
jgi:hypothetical protein